MGGVNDLTAKAVGYLAKIRKEHHWRSQFNDILGKSVVFNPSLPRELEKEIREYYKKFGFKIKTDWHQYIYNVTGEYSPLMIPEDFFHSVLERIYNVRGFTAWEDKAFMPFILKDVIFPETICCCVNGYFYDANRDMVSQKTAMKIIMENENAIAKPTLALGGGKGIVLVDCSNPEQTLKSLRGTNFIIQKIIRQSPQMARFNPSSVNTEKIVSFLFQGEVFILSTIVRVGALGSITDNVGEGNGWIIGINDNGEMRSCGLDVYGHIYETDFYGKKIEGTILSHHEEICEIIKRSHKLFPYFGLMSWDFCVNEKNQF